MKKILLVCLLFSLTCALKSQIKLDSGLVAFYPFNGNANDASGHGNNPVFNNAVLTSDINGSPNSAYHFDGSSSYMRIPNSVSLNMANKISISMNIKPTGFYAGACRANNILAKGDDDNIGGTYIIRFSDIIDPCNNSSTDDEHFYGAGGAHSSTVVQLNKWYSLVWTYDGATAKVYVNGVLVASAGATISSFTNSYDLFLGKLNNAQFPYWFNGDLDEVRIYNRVLTSDEATVLASRAAPTITSFSPTSGGADATIIITGTNFNAASAVKFGGTAAKSFTINSATKITAKVGTGSTGAVTVTTPGGTATRSGFSFCVTATIKITADANATICANTLVTFLAKPQNGGTAPAYQWQKNGTNVGTNSSVYSDSTLQTGDTIKCILTSNASPCVAVNNVSSNALTFTVNPNLTPTAVITSANSNVAVCLGGKIQFSAIITNGGSNPVYQWIKNGVAAGTNSTSFSDGKPVTGDSIALMVTSNAACLVTASVKSNSLVERVDVPTPVIKIASNKDTSICSGTKVTFTATVTPSYLWKKNGAEVGGSTNKYVDSTLKTNDDVQCFLVSSATACNNNASNIINSNILQFKVNAPPAKPSAISGPASVLAHQTGIYFNVTAVAGVTYIWALPSGALIDSGQGGNKIKVTWGTAAGTVSVVAANGCGSSVAQTKAVTIKASLAVAEAQGASKKSLDTDDDVRLTPNPASTFAMLTFTAKTAGKYVITITDAQNKVVQVKNVVSIKGQNQLKLNTAGFAKGAYFITLTSNAGSTKSKQLIVGE